jgi:hypothetical protein
MMHTSQFIFLVYTWNQKMVRYAYLGQIKEVTLNLKDLHLPIKVISHIPKAVTKRYPYFYKNHNISPIKL